MTLPPAQREPIAIVGLGCRFPGGIRDAATFWAFLASGRNAISEVPADRWNLDSFYHPDPSRPGRILTRHGGFLDAIDQFDPAFFGFSPREAAFLDPQQRLLLETAWEAFEDAGQPARNLAGSRTAVFVGEFALDYKLLLLSPAQRERIGIHTCTGSFATVLANRLSHWFDLRGPSVTLDTACSSSLVAVHLACQSLWSGESDLALAGGVNAIFKPEWTIAVAKGGFLSPDGQCRAFDARANGYVRSEGAGVVLLKPLAAALANRDRIYALIRGTASNQDGRTSGITVPNPDAQIALMREAFARGGVDPAQVHYLEAHGTGTAVGDPAEAAAIGAVVSAGRAAGDPCLLGSVKTNLGHLEAAAGVAGLIKAALCLHRQAIPASLHFDTPNPAIDFQALGLRVPTVLEPWPGATGSRFCGVNSFGFGGANAHVVLQDARENEPDTRPDAAPGPCLIPLSARSEPALRELAARYAAQFRAPESESGPGPALTDLAYSAGVRRDHHPIRLALVSGSPAEAAAGLAAFAAGTPHPAIPAAGTAPSKPERLAFVYPGMGPQWFAMGRGLLASEPVFRAMLERCDDLLRPLAGWSLLEELGRGEEASRIQETFIAQPAIFAIQAALTELWRSWGIRPDAVVGHSVGEAAAQVASGAVTIEEALSIIFNRSRLQHRTAGSGTMLAAGLTEAEAGQLLAPFQGRASIAAINSPTDLTLSGERATLEEIERALSGRNIFARFLQVPVPYHSRGMDPIRGELLASLAQLRPRPPAVPLVSTVTGARVQGPELDAAYWWRNVRQPVRFSAAVQTLLDDGIRVFLEIGPHPVLAHSIAQGAGARPVHVLGSLRRKEPERPAMLASLGRLYTLGFSPDWNALYPQGRFVRFPSYPWQRERCWLESETVRQDRIGRPAHPLLGSIKADAACPVWQRDLGAPSLDYLLDHNVQGAPVFPAAGYVEMALAAAREKTGLQTLQLRDLSFSRPLFLDPAEAQSVQLFLGGAAGRWEIHSTSLKTPGAWTRHAGGIFTDLHTDLPAPVLDARPLENACPQPRAVEDAYQAFAGIGLDYGPAFRGILSLATGERAALASVRTSEEPGYILHPALLDACLQTLLAAYWFGCPSPRRDLFLPVRIQRLNVYADTRASARCVANVRDLADTAFTGAIRLLDPAGRVLAEAEGICCQALPDNSRATAGPLAHLLYHQVWTPADVPPAPAGAPAGGPWVLLARRPESTERLAQRLRAAGSEVAVVTLGLRCQGSGCQGSGQPLEGRRPRRPRPAGTPALQKEKLIQNPVSYTVPSGAPPAGIIVLADAPESDAADPFSACLDVLRLLRTPADQARAPRLWLVTHACQPVQGHDVRVPALAALWGLGRVAANEHPDSRCSLVDLDAAPAAASEAALDILARLLLADGPETELAIRDSRAWAARLEPLAADALPARTVPARDLLAAGRSFRLETSRPGALDRLAFVAAERLAPGPGELEIRVRAAGLNFKDIAKAMGLLSDASLAGTYTGRGLGLECAGTIERIGPGVSGFKPGDEVVAFPRHGFSPYALADARLAGLKPPALSFEQAATIPLVFTTAYFSLCRLARLARGERVLIHSASGGLGLAAIQFARLAGADIYATAGTPEKREFLLSLGVKAAWDSRSPAFAQALLAATGGRGADVVLNFLTGDLFEASLDCLAEGGRFLELGKRDLEQDRPLSLGHFQNNISFLSVDLDKLATARPETVGDMLRTVLEMVTDGRLQPLPLSCLPISGIHRHFDDMLQARHRGKLAVHFDAPDLAVRDPGHPLIRPDATYLVTGGLRGFGLEAGRWLVSRGARHLALLGRGQPPGPAEQAVLDELRVSAQVRILKADITSRPSLRAALAGLAAEMPPIRGVLHGANVYADATLDRMSDDQFALVLGPKATGAQNLHTLLGQTPLDFAVLFSSISALIGNPGQANYSAANAFLDSWACWLRDQGVPALSVNWGPIAAAGYAARNQAVDQHLRRIGFDALAPALAFDALARLLDSDAVQAAVTALDWNRWAPLHPAAVAPRYSLVARPAADAGAGATAGASLRAVLAAAAPDTRAALARDLLQRHVAEVLGLDPAKPLDPDRGFFDLGLDSMLSMELRNRLQKAWGSPLPATLAFKHPTLQSLAAFFLQAAQSQGQAPDAPTTLTETLDQLSIPELAERLAKTLEGMKE